jgi:hypothetical protein
MQKWITVLMVSFLAGMPLLASATVAPSGHAATVVSETTGPDQGHASSTCCGQDVGATSQSHQTTRFSLSTCKADDNKPGDRTGPDSCPEDCPVRGGCGQAVLCGCAAAPVMTQAVRPVLPSAGESYLLSRAPTARLASASHVERLKRPPRSRTLL